MDIIFLFLGCWYIRNKVKAKGYESWQWILRTIVIWMLCELVGSVVSLMIRQDLFIAAASGLLCALAGFLFVRNSALQLPDQRNNNNDDWWKNTGSPDQF